MSNSANANARKEEARPFQFSLRYLLISVSIICAVLALASWLGGLAIGRIREAECSVNLYSLGLALHNYHDRYGCFPPALVTDESGAPAHSWRIVLLEYVDASHIYEQYDFAEPWNGRENSRIGKLRPSMYRCPSDPMSKKGVATSYLALTGPGTAWPGTACAKLSDFDDPGKVILLIEVAGANVHWMERRDLVVTRADPVIDSKTSTGISGHHKGGAKVLFADGSIRYFSADMLPAEVQALLTPPK